MAIGGFHNTYPLPQYDVVIVLYSEVVPTSYQLPPSFT